MYMNFEYCEGKIHVVEEGDTLYRISRNYNVPLAMLLRANPYTDVYNLQIGSEICIPVMSEHPVLKPNVSNQPAEVMPRPIPETLPAHTAKPMPATMPAQTANPMQATMPAQTANPMPATMPAQTANPMQATMPAQTANPMQATMPAQTAKPMPAVMPAQSAKPMPATMPAQTAKPMPATMPAQTAKPMPATMPAQTKKPMQSIMPAQTANPMQAIMPAQTVKSMPSPMPVHRSARNVITMPDNNYLDMMDNMILYVVRDDDTLGSLLERFNMDLRDLLKFNNLSGICLKSGSTVRLPENNDM